MWGDWWWRKPCYHPIETNCSFYAGTLLYIKLIRYPMIPKLILITGQQPSIALAEVTQRETICQALCRWSLTTHPWLDSMLFPGVLLWQGSPLSFHKKPVQLPSHTIYRILIDTHTPTEINYNFRCSWSCWSCSPSSRPSTICTLHFVLTFWLTLWGIASPESNGVSARLVTTYHTGGW